MDGLRQIGKYIGENQDLQRMKTLWDWLKLLLVQAVLAGGGYLFTRSENRRTERSADQSAMDAALQSYLDQMSILLIDKHLHGEYRPHGDTRGTARARTLTVLEELDGGRKRSVVQFLREARLINRMDEDLEGRLVHARVVGLDGADLTDADLKGGKLHNAFLKEANLKCADLTETDLRGADLRGANLKDASLRGMMPRYRGQKVSPSRPPGLIPTRLMRGTFAALASHP
jgi:Pentapeptide repeats (8 copies)